MGYMTGQFMCCLQAPRLELDSPRGQGVSCVPFGPQARRRLTRLISPRFEILGENKAARRNGKTARRQETRESRKTRESANERCAEPCPRP